MSVVLVSSVPWDELRPVRGDPLEPIHLYLPSSSRDGTSYPPSCAWTDFGRNSQNPHEPLLILLLYLSSPLSQIPRPDPLDPSSTYFITVRDRIPILDPLADIHINLTPAFRTVPLETSISRPLLSPISIERDSQVTHRPQTPTQPPFDCSY